MNLQDYILSQEGLNLSEMLREWNWALPSAFDVWMVTRFADLIIAQEDGSVWFLDTSGGSYRRIADSGDHFAALANDVDTFRDWFMVSAVDEMVAAGHVLGPQQCYSFQHPPGLGGDYTLANYMVTDLHVHLALHGQIFGKTKDVPYGTKVTLTVDRGVQPKV